MKTPYGAPASVPPWAPGTRTPPLRFTVQLTKKKKVSSRFKGTRQNCSSARDTDDDEGKMASRFNVETWKSVRERLSVRGLFSTCERSGEEEEGLLHPLSLSLTTLHIPRASARPYGKMQLKELTARRQEEHASGAATLWDHNKPEKFPITETKKKRDATRVGEDEPNRAGEGGLTDCRDPREPEEIIIILI